MKKTLDERYFQKVLLQFRIKKFNDVPEAIRQFKRQPTQGCGTAPKGTQVLSSTKDASAIQLLLDLERDGYRLSDTFYEERGRQDDRHYMAFFIFTPCGNTSEPSECFARVKSAVVKGLFDLCKEALWEPSAFINPTTDEAGRILHGRHWASIVFRGRQPYMQGNGEPVLIYPKDASGERTSNLPAPLRPAAHLCMNKQGGFIAVPA